MEPLKQAISLSKNENKCIAGRKNVSVMIDVKDVSFRFNTHVKTLNKCHIHVQRFQHTVFNNLKSNLKERKEILI